MPYNIEKQSSSDKPSLEEMVDAALDILERDKKGFFLFVEGKMRQTEKGRAPPGAKYCSCKLLNAIHHSS